MRRIVTAALTAALALTGTSAYAASTSTQLSNGVLYFTAEDGSVVSGVSSLFYGATKYKKTGGGQVYVVLRMETSGGTFRSPEKSVSAGQTVSHSFGGQSKSKYAADCKATGWMTSNNGGPFWTPTVRFC
ncbi:hypothetical protein [Streptomyces sp. URMC 125]|uniref:hypothetical protein n=1 Tax=Streptomyces sp. URMC 125 TaxID=3423419 RepID=UPI003F1D0F52